MVVPAGIPSAGALAVLELAEHALEVERQRGHRQLVAVAAPLLARPVAVDLDPVPLGVPEVERLAHEVVGGAGEAPAGAGQPLERARQLGAIGHQDREVEEPGAEARRPRRVGCAHQLDHGLATRGAEAREATVALDRVEADHALVEGGEAVEVRHPQAHLSDRCVRGNHVTASMASDSVRKKPKKMILSARTRAPSQ